MHVFLHSDTDMPKNFMFSSRYIAANSSSVGLQCITFFNKLGGVEPTELRIVRMPPLAVDFDGVHV
jgi:hypothetical protein